MGFYLNARKKWIVGKFANKFTVLSNVGTEPNLSVQRSLPSTFAVAIWQQMWACELAKWKPQIVWYMFWN